MATVRFYNFTWIGASEDDVLPAGATHHWWWWGDVEFGDAISVTAHAIYPNTGEEYDLAVSNVIVSVNSAARLLDFFVTNKGQTDVVGYIVGMSFVNS